MKKVLFAILALAFASSVVDVQADYYRNNASCSSCNTCRGGSCARGGCSTCATECVGGTCAAETVVYQSGASAATVYQPSATVEEAVVIRNGNGNGSSMADDVNIAVEESI